MVSTPVPSPFMAAVRNRPLMILAAGHFTVDMYSGILPVLYPLLTGRFNLDLASVGLVSLAYSGSASLSQPFFGWIADRFGTRFTGAALAWTGILFATIGFAPTYSLLLVMATLAGFGSGAFHPFGAVNANAVIPDHQKNTAMSIYATGGTIGVAAGPIVGALLFATFGMEGTAVMLLPGVSIAIWLLFAMKSGQFNGAEMRTTRAIGHLGPIPYRILAVIVAVMMLRAMPIFGMHSFIPIWYQSLGYGPSFYGPLATTVVLASAVGAIGAGNLADAHGRRSVILWSLILTIPAIWLFAQFPGPWGFATGALVGLLAASTTPLLLVMSQQLMRGRAGVASGLILGLGFIAGAIGTPIVGALADAFGMQNAIRSMLVVVVGTIGIAWMLPTEARLLSAADQSFRVNRTVTPESSAAPRHSP